MGQLLGGGGREGLLEAPKGPFPYVTTGHMLTIHLRKPTKGSTADSCIFMHECRAYIENSPIFEHNYTSFLCPRSEVQGSQSQDDKGSPTGGPDPQTPVGSHLADKQRVFFQGRDTR